MNIEEHLTFRTRLYILEKILTQKQKLYMNHLFDFIFFLSDFLLENKIEFNINTISYSDLVSLKHKKLNSFLKIYSKKEITSFLSYFKKIYNFDHIINSKYNEIEATFSNKDLTLIINKKNIITKFKIEQSLIRYQSYIVNDIEYLIEENILFKIETFEKFINNIEKQFNIEKKILKMIFY